MCLCKKGGVVMKWLSLVQTILLAILCILMVNFKTITTAGMIVFEIFLVAVFVISIIMFVRLKKNKK